MIVSAHQPNFLPGISVIRKIAESDAVIWVDEVQYSHYSFTARNKLRNEQPILVPLKAVTRQGPINRVEIASIGNWRKKLCRTLELIVGDKALPYIEQIRRPYGLLVGLNAALLWELREDFRNYAFAEWHWQSQLVGGRKLESIVDDRETSGVRRQISYQLAAMTEEIGGTIYLSGPSGKNYLDEIPFKERNIEVRYYEHTGDNYCCLSYL